MSGSILGSSNNGDDVVTSVYKKTATKANNGKVFAFGRMSELDGRPVSEGGYALYRLKSNYNGQVRGGMETRWVVVRSGLAYADAVSLMNVKCGYQAFK